VHLVVYPLRRWLLSTNSASCGAITAKHIKLLAGCEKVREHAWRGHSNCCVCHLPRFTLMMRSLPAPLQSVSVTPSSGGTAHHGTSFAVQFLLHKTCANGSALSVVLAGDHAIYAHVSTHQGTVEPRKRSACLAHNAPPGANCTLEPRAAPAQPSNVGHSPASPVHARAARPATLPGTPKPATSPPPPKGGAPSPAGRKLQQTYDTSSCSSSLGCVSSAASLAAATLLFPVQSTWGRAFGLFPKGTTTNILSSLFPVSKMITTAESIANATTCALALKGSTIMQSETSSNSLVAALKAAASMALSQVMVFLPLRSNQYYFMGVMPFTKGGLKGSWPVLGGDLVAVVQPCTNDYFFAGNGLEVDIPIEVIEASVALTGLGFSLGANIISSDSVADTYASLADATPIDMSDSFWTPYSDDESLGIRGHIWVAGETAALQARQRVGSLRVHCRAIFSSR
jgi:hypothetical protein